MNKATTKAEQTIIEYLGGTKISRQAVSGLKGKNVTISCMTEDGPMEFGLLFHYETNSYSIERTGVTTEDKLSPKHWSEL
jgi:CRISPR/Cas system type I-B associated protein Csh2 (Cas7 group RAMP superfamily)